MIKIQFCYREILELFIGGGMQFVNGNFWWSRLVYFKKKRLLMGLKTVETRN